jgi:hypothetical protein
MKDEAKKLWLHPALSSKSWAPRANLPWMEGEVLEPAWADRGQALSLPPHATTATPTHRHCVRRPSVGAPAWPLPFHMSPCVSGSSPSTRVCDRHCAHGLFGWRRQGILECGGSHALCQKNVISDTTIRDTKTKRVTNNLSVTRVHEMRHRLVVVHAPGARRVTNNDVFVTRVNKTRHG